MTLYLEVIETRYEGKNGRSAHITRSLKSTSAAMIGTKRLSITMLLFALDPHWILRQRGKKVAQRIFGRIAKIIKTKRAEYQKL